ncbi:MAG: hypothetical protein U9R38_00430 [Candidatus Margulisiibacteriota bacterium]|nr:hypothetical protein [Candidatus Margulisiibacteriota bacterium]
MINELKNYCNTWWAIIMQPIWFYTRLKEEDWREKSLSFLLITSWIIGLSAAIVIFVVQYVPIGGTLIEGLHGLNFLMIMPVLATLAFVFFVITLLILGGAFSLGFFLMFYLTGVVLHYVYIFLKGKGSMNRMIQSMFYSTAAIQSVLLVLLLMIISKFGSLSFQLFQVGFEVIYFFTLLYLYGLWAIAGRKTYGVPKWLAFAGAIVPVILLLIFGILFDKIALSRLQPWIT